MFKVCQWLYRITLVGGAVALAYLVLLVESDSPFKKELDSQVEGLILHRLQSKAELTTAEFHSQGTVEVNQVDNFLGFESESRLVYQGLGKISAGVNLEKLTADSLSLQGSTLCLTLPPVEILDVEIEVLNSPRAQFEKGLLGGDSLALLEQAQLEFIQKVHQEAQESGVLEEAQNNAIAWAQTFIEPLIPAYHLQVAARAEDCLLTTSADR